MYAANNLRTNRENFIWARSVEDYRHAGSSPFPRKRWYEDVVLEQSQFHLNHFALLKIKHRAAWLAAKDWNMSCWNGLLRYWPNKQSSHWCRKYLISFSLLYHNFSITSSLITTIKGGKTSLIFECYHSHRPHRHLNTPISKAISKNEGHCVLSPRLHFAGLWTARSSRWLL